jgi:hypothetical protein
MKIKEIMSKDVEIVFSDPLLHKSALKRRQNYCSRSLVTKHERPAGIADDRDLEAHYVANVCHAEDKKAYQNMTKNKVPEEGNP